MPIETMKFLNQRQGLHHSQQSSSQSFIFAPIHPCPPIPMDAWTCSELHCSRGTLSLEKSLLLQQVRTSLLPVQGEMLSHLPWLLTAVMVWRDGSGKECHNYTFSECPARTCRAPWQIPSPDSPHMWLIYRLHLTPCSWVQNGCFVAIHRFYIPNWKWIPNGNIS